MNKYKIGQSVYWICDKNNEVYPNVLMVNRVSIDSFGHHYSLTTPDDDIIDWCREEDVFMDKNDAENEADERNNIETIGV
jgi:hypothetical protein